MHPTLPPVTLRWLSIASRALVAKAPWDVIAVAGVWENKVIHTKAGGSRSLVQRGTALTCRTI